MKPKLLIAVNKTKFNELFSKKDVSRLEEMCEFICEPPEVADEAFLIDHIGEADIAISSWGTARFSDEVVGLAPNLKLLCHAAGSVKPVVSDAIWEKQVSVTSSAAAISYGVAEFCLGLILTASKRVYWAARDTRKGGWDYSAYQFNGPFEIYQQKIGIIGASYVGKHLISLLKNFACDILLYDPYCSSEQADSLGVEKVDAIEELFRQCKVVSLNAPLTDSTKNMIRGKHFAALQDGALFINTARGAIVNQQEMVEELKKERFIACVDVTEPEPPAEDDLLRSLPNVLLTPHQAGAIAENLLRIGTFVADEIEALCAGQPFVYEVAEEMLSRVG